MKAKYICDDFETAFRCDEHKCEKCKPIPRDYTPPIFEVPIDQRPEPTFLYETTIQFATQIAVEREKFIISASQKLGINPLIVQQQSEMIKEFKGEILKIRYQLSLFNATFPMDLDAFPALAEFLDPREV